VVAIVLPSWEVKAVMTMVVVVVVRPFRAIVVFYSILVVVVVPKNRNGLLSIEAQGPEKKQRI